MNLEEALASARHDSDHATGIHKESLLWLDSVPVDTEVTWLPKGWASRGDSEETSHLISAADIRQIRGIVNAGRTGLSSRAMHVLDERCAMQKVVRSLLARSRSFPYLCPASDLFVRYSTLGQPNLGWGGEAAEWGRRSGIRLRDLQISFTHDGDAVLAIAAHSTSLRGVGIDIVRLDRLRGKGRDYLHRFARHFMSESEHEHFAAASIAESEDETVHRVAAHFSLMESASKALGTGLKIGGGMGKPESLPKRSINVRVSGVGGRVSGGQESQPPEVEFDLESDAKDRIRHLKATRLEGYFSADSEYLVSAAFLRS